MAGFMLSSGDIQQVVASTTRYPPDWQVGDTTYFLIKIDK